MEKKLNQISCTHFYTTPEESPREECSSFLSARCLFSLSPDVQPLIISRTSFVNLLNPRIENLPKLLAFSGAGDTIQLAQWPPHPQEYFYSPRLCCKMKETDANGFMKILHIDPWLLEAAVSWIPKNPPHRFGGLRQYLQRTAQLSSPYWDFASTLD